MRTLAFSSLTCFVSAFGLLANLGNHHEVMDVLAAYAVWLPFIFYYRARRLRIRARQRRAYLYEQCLRTYLLKNRQA